MADALKKWLCLQLGSREHYAIPRVLEQRGQLTGLLTDSWIRPQWQPIVSKFSRSLALRRHRDLPDDKVKSPTLRRVLFDILLRARRVATWDGMYQRNQWFQRWSAKQVTLQAQPAGICFSYSYGARLPFKEAKRLGMGCVLGQIDPGPLEQQIVDEKTSQYKALKLDDGGPSEGYWHDWKEELELADQIVVNSPWSHQLLVRQGVSAAKIQVIPLAYEGIQLSAVGSAFPLPRADTRPFTVLFLGQVILRKGIGQLFDAIRVLEKEPIRFILAGPVGVKIPPFIASNSRVEILGPVDRLRAEALYRQSDVFILPTLSDGFAITQLEAVAHGLPVIASKACGEVVTDGVNGIILAEVTPSSIVSALRQLLDDRDSLPRFRNQLDILDRFSLKALGDNLLQLEV